MAFWGIEVKPGKPYTHRHDDKYGRLHISQATLDYGPSLKKCVVQCNVGKKAPILLCALLPEKTESCPLNLEFEEVEEVVFSVLGPKSVHLTGYFVVSGHGFNQDGDDTESYGEDIGDTETDRSNDNEDDYEEDFIDDGDPKVFPSSPDPKNRAADMEMVNNAKPKESAIRRRLKKKYQHSDTETGEDDQSPADTEMVDDAKLENENSTRRHLKKYQVSDSEAGEDDQSPGDTEMVNNAKLKKENAAKKCPKKYQVSDSAAGKVDQSQILDSGFGLGSEDEDDIPLSSVMKLEQTKIVQAEGEVGSRPSDEVGEDKKDDDKSHRGIGFKRKADAFEGDNDLARVTNQASDTLVTSSNDISKSGLKSMKKKKDSSIEKQVIDSADSDVYFECHRKQKKSKKESAEATIVHDGSDQAVEMKESAEATIVHDGSDQVVEIANICSDDVMPLIPVKDTETDMIIREQPSIIHDSSLKLLDKDIEGKEKKKQMRSKEINTNANGEEIGSMMEGENESSKEMTLVVQTSGLETSNPNIEGKKKKKKMKGKGTNTSAYSEKIGSMVLETEHESSKEMKSLSQTSGPETLDRLVIEELEVGKSYGRTASDGDKVSIYYTGRLKETGEVFDSNIGQKSFKLRLGKQRVIAGLEAGISGMRIGDKRRLTIPPSLGYGADGAEGVPKDAWLIYEIELTNIR